VKPLAIAFSYTTVSSDLISSDGSGLFLGLLAAGAIYVASFLGLTILTAYNYHFDLPHSSFVLRILRAVATLSTTILFLPLSSVLIRGLGCTASHSDWMGTGLECWSPGRIVIAVILAILLIGFALLSLIVTTVYVDRNPVSQSWIAKTNGRIDAFALGVKFTLAFLYNAVGTKLIGAAGTTVFLILVGIITTWLYATYQPFVRAWVNAFNAGMWAIFTLSAVCLGLAQATGSPDSTYLLLYVGAPAVFAAAFMGTTSYALNVAESSLE